MAIGIDEGRCERSHSHSWALILVARGSICRPEAVPTPVWGEVPVTCQDHWHWAVIHQRLQAVSDELLLATGIARG